MTEHSMLELFVFMVAFLILIFVLALMIEWFTSPGRRK